MADMNMPGSIGPGAPAPYRRSTTTPTNNKLFSVLAPTSTIKLEEAETKLLRERSFHTPLYLSKENATPELTTYGIKLGWIQGVLIPCLLNIWGVMLFLRIAWVVAQAGMGFTTLIIIIAAVVCIITTLSLSAICTNGQVQGGGVYYLVSRSLGAELGASVGIIFAFANAVAASMNTIGFCESLNELLKSHGLKLVDNGVQDTRIVGAIALLAMCLICAIGMDWESKAQNFLVVIIVLAIFNYVIGSCMGPTSQLQQAQGFTGLSGSTASDNWHSDFRYSENMDHNFLSVFAIYFPAVTGVQAGANICGDLKNPAKAIPRGTLWAVGISTTSYLTVALLAGSGAARDASGSLQDMHNGTLADCKPNCEYGLHNNYEIMNLMALWGPFTYGGCWAATLSTALTNLLSVPRLIQALGIDRIYPGIIFFSKPYGRHGEPYRGYVLTFCISLVFLLIADLNTIAPLITNFYLASYALINFCTFHAGFTKAISWRPTFKYYNTWLSLAGFIICNIIMILLNWIMALVTVLVFLTLYMLVVYRHPDARWGSSRDAARYHETVSMLLTMSSHARHVKEYSPQPLVLCGSPPARRALLDVAALITAGASFMIVGDITKQSVPPTEFIKHKQSMEQWLYMQKYRAFYVYLEAMNLESGAKMLMQCSGLGRFSPNIVLMGYKTDWFKGPPDDIVSYVEILRLAFERQFAVCIFRVPRYLEEAPSLTEQRANKKQESMHKARTEFSVMHTSSDFQLDKLEREESRERVLKITTPKYRDSDPNILKPLAPFKSFIYKPLHINTTNFVDTWWLYDDGGLTILLSYIITERSMKDKLPLRIFALPKLKTEVKESKKSIEKLLNTYRISYSQLVMVTGLVDPPKNESWNLFDSIVRNYKSEDNGVCCITSDELSNQHAKTSRYLRLRELVLRSSSGAEMIIMSLPMAKRESVSPALYMAWLEVLSLDLPPILFVRGNNTTVLGV